MSLQKKSTLIWLLLYVNTATQFQGKKETPKCNYINTTLDDTCCPDCTNLQNDSCKTYGCPKEYYQLKGKCYEKHDEFESNMVVCKRKCPSSHYGITLNENKVCLACFILCQDSSLKTTCSCEDILKETQSKGILLYIFIGLSALLAVALGMMVVYVCCKNRSGDIKRNSTKCTKIDGSDTSENPISFNADKTKENNLSGQQKGLLFSKEDEKEVDEKPRYTKYPTSTEEPEKSLPNIQSDRPSSSPYENSSSIRKNEGLTDEMDKTRFKDTKCNLPPINDDEREIKISKGGISPSESEIVDRSVTESFSTTLDVTNGNTPKEDNKEGDYDTVEEDPDEKGYETLHFQDETIEIFDVENITQSKKQGLVRGRKAACSFKKCKISDNNKNNNFESDSFSTDIKNRASDISSSSVETGKSECPKSDLVLSKIIVSEPFVQTLPESDAHQYENYQGSTSDVDNINPVDFTTDEDTPLPIMRKYANMNVNEKVASANKHSNRCSQDSSDSNKSEDSYTSACSHMSLQENSVVKMTSNKEETIIEIDASNIVSDVNNVAVLKGSVEVTKIASQPTINIINGNNVSLNLVCN
ncbi:dentin sialophosphoprotein-like [Mytilus trossulus]|uniref:dentin sialophosphoprotein-like n=1 Tax=Mytilus trossulus TaxID=6551 RepID=UPI003007918E